MNTTTTRTSARHASPTLRHAFDQPEVTDGELARLRSGDRQAGRVWPRVWARLETNRHTNPLTGACRPRTPTSRVGPMSPITLVGSPSGRGAE